MDNDRSTDHIKKIKKDIYDILQIMKGLDSDIKGVQYIVKDLKQDVKQYDTRNLSNVFKGDNVDNLETKLNNMEQKVRAINQKSMSCDELESLEARIDRYISCQVERKLEESLCSINAKFNSIDQDIKTLTSKIVKHQVNC